MPHTPLSIYISRAPCTLSSTALAHLVVGLLDVAGHGSARHAQQSVEVVSRSSRGYRTPRYRRENRENETPHQNRIKWRRDKFVAS